MEHLAYDIESGDYTPAHNLRVSVTPIQFSLKIAPLGRRAKIIPYVGAGVGVARRVLLAQGGEHAARGQLALDVGDGGGERGGLPALDGGVMLVPGVEGLGHAPCGVLPGLDPTVAGQALQKALHLHRVS